METTSESTNKQSRTFSTKQWLLIILGTLSLLVLVIALMIYSSVTNTYNKYQTFDEKNNALWSEVTNQYQRRADLIPSILASVKGEAAFEKSTLTAVIEARSKANSVQLTADALKDPQAMQAFSQHQGDLTQALSKLMMLTENYPQLRSNTAFQELRSQLEGTENRIAVARNRYIQGVNAENSLIRIFPGNIVAGFFQLQIRPQFTVTNEAAVSVAPQISFDNK